MILVRHAQSEFNVHYSVTRIDPGIRDPELTELGRVQAAQTAELLRGRPVRRLVTSPYKRALQTAEIIAEALSLPVVIDPVVGERGAFVCDLGSPPDELSRLFPRLSFGHLEASWWPVQEESEERLLGRCRRFREHMAALQDWPQVAVVTHWGFIRALTGLSVTNAEVLSYDPTAPLPAEAAGPA